MKYLFGAALLLCIASACGKPEAERERKPIADSLIELDLTHAPVEQQIGLFDHERPSHFEALTRLRTLLRDPLARGLFLRLGEFGGQFADVDDWAATLDAYRAAKKPVHCHFDTLDNSGYALAAHCDRISMTPSGMLDLVGISVHAVHGRALLESIGVKADLFQVGKYKGAAEPFTRDNLSPEQRQSLDVLLDDLDRAFRGHLAQRAHGGPEAVQKIIDQGPYTPERAQEAGLIDAITFDDEARAHAKKASAARVVHHPYESRDDKKAPSLSELVRLLAGHRDRAYEGRPHLAVGFLVGEITDGDARALDVAASDPFVRQLRRWGDQPDVRAVVLRIESPGGSALASDRMWHAVQRVAKRKPVIVSLGDMAASGGYYVASAGTAIVASPGSIVGSIGVVGGKVVIAGLADRLGVHVSSLNRGARADWLSSLRDFNPGERAMFESMLQHTYGLFLERVAAGRKRPVSELIQAAEGRVMGGERARELGLVDEVGGLARAMTLALERGKLPENVPIETWPESSDPFETISTLMGAREPASMKSDLPEPLLQALPRELASGAGLVRSLSRAPTSALTVLPFALHLR